MSPRFAAVLLALLATACTEFEYREPAPSSAPPSTSADPSAPNSSGAPAGSTSTSTGRPPAGESPRRSNDPFEEARRQIEEARNLPLPSGNYRVDVQRIWLSQQDSSTVSAMFGWKDDNWDVRVGSPGADPGFRVAVAKGGFTGSIDGNLRSAKSASREQTFIVTVANSPASIQVGQVRFVQPIHVAGAAGGIILPAGQFLGTSLNTIVRPAGQGVVQVSLTPVFSAPNGDLIELTQMTTTVNAPLGASILIANNSTSHDSVATALLSRTSSSGAEQAVIVLNVSGG